MADTLTSSTISGTLPNAPAEKPGWERINGRSSGGYYRRALGSSRSRPDGAVEGGKR